MMYRRSLVCVSLIAAITACSNPTAISEQTKQLALPTNWQSGVSIVDTTYKTLGDWRLIVEDEQLQQIINKALVGNQKLNAQYQELLIAKQQLVVSNATDFPELSLVSGQSRQKSVGDSTSYQNYANIDLQLSYEVDLWGKLSNQQQKAKLDYQAAKLAFMQAKNELITNVVSAWFNLAEAKQLNQLYVERAHNLKNNLSIINASYQLGLSEALDVYLTQNDVSRELARIEQQQQVVKERERAMDILIGQYPIAVDYLNMAIELPKLSDDIFVELPSNAMTASYQVQEKWIELLAADANLAVAHKQRFPSLTLTASGGDTSDELLSLLDGGSLAWSIAGNLVAPVFNGGRLAAQEEQARLTVKKVEQDYISNLYSEFAEIENQISQHYSLTQQLSHYQNAKGNALSAETLSFNQYQKGLVSYSTVLESQRRAFDSSTSVVQISNQLVQNRIALYANLGGNALAQSFQQKVTPKSQSQVIYD